MNRFKQLCAAFVLTLALAFSAFAGEMDTGRAGQIEIGKAGEIQTTITGQIDTMRAASTIEVTLNLFLSMLPLI